MILSAFPTLLTSWSSSLSVCVDCFCCVEQAVCFVWALQSPSDGSPVHSLSMNKDKKVLLPLADVIPSIHYAYPQRVAGWLVPFSSGHWAIGRVHPGRLPVHHRGMGNYFPLLPRKTLKTTQHKSAKFVFEYSILFKKTWFGKPLLYLGNIFFNQNIEKENFQIFLIKPICV